MKGGPGDTFGAVLRILRSEGVDAAANRVRDRLSEHRRLRSFPRLTPDQARGLVSDDRPLVLNLSPIPASPRRGGSQIQMLDRLDEEAKLRPIAVAFQHDRTLEVELRTRGGSGRLSLDTNAGVSSAVVQAAQALQISLVHIENLHGFPSGLVEDLEEAGLSTVVSVHDFTLYCRRPHLIDSTTGEFCGYSTDPDRCRACLDRGRQGLRTSQEEYRRLSRQILERLRAVVYPSEFLLKKHHEIFSGLAPAGTEVVISPSTAGRPRAAVPHRDLSAIAFVGGFALHKGGALIPSVLKRIATSDPHFKAFVYGNGDDRLSGAIRSAGHVRIRGYYRPGCLPKLLAHDHIGVAVLPSIWPETYGLVVDECLATGVPVVAFALGAVGERLEAWGAGCTVPPDGGAEGLATAVIAQMSKASGVPSDVARRIPVPHDAAEGHIALYLRLLGRSA